MRTAIALALMLCAGFAARAQTLHTPAEIYKIMEDSWKMYKLDVYDPDTVKDDDDAVLISAELYATQDKGRWVLWNYVDLLESRPAVVEMRDRAERYFADGEMEKARAEYLRVLDSLPAYSRVMTYVGQTYGSGEDLDEAISWYRRAIDRNRIDFMAHWFLADILSKRGKHDEAVDEILTAHLLNRNNPRIMTSFKRILQNAGLRYMDWEFEPRYRVHPLDTHNISVAFPEDAPEWMSYAITKAIWQYEPGYREKMEQEHGAGTLIVEEKECLLGLLAAMMVEGGDEGVQLRKKMESDPGFRMMKNAMVEDVLEEFIVYELASPRNPLVMYGMNDEFFEATIEYVKKYRIEPADAR